MTDRVPFERKTNRDAELREHVMKRNALPQLCCGRAEEGERSVDSDHSCLGAVSEHRAT